MNAWNWADSSIYIDSHEWSISKHYCDHINLDDLETYENMHSQISKKSYCFSLKNTLVDLNWNNIKNIEVSFLDIGKNFYAKNCRIIHTVPYVKGYTINRINNYINIKNHSEKIGLIDEIEREISKYIGQEFSIKPYWDSIGFTPHIVSINIKIIKVENNTLFLMVTDIWNRIKDIVDQYRQRASEIVEHM